MNTWSLFLSLAPSAVPPDAAECCGHCVPDPSQDRPVEVLSPCEVLQKAVSGELSEAQRERALRRDAERIAVENNDRWREARSEVVRLTEENERHKQELGQLRAERDRFAAEFNGRAERGEQLREQGRNFAAGVGRVVASLVHDQLRLAFELERALARQAAGV